jgi:hypothetical protein
MLMSENNLEEPSEVTGFPAEEGEGPSCENDQWAFDPIYSRWAETCP